MTPHRQGPAEPRAGRDFPSRTAVVTWWRPVLIVSTAAALTLVVVDRGGGKRLPNFSAIADATERKAAFIAHIEPLARAVNAELARPRERLLAIDATLAAGWTVDDTQAAFVRRVARRNAIPAQAEIDRALLARVLERVDAVPTSLVVAQAAVESGWGTSRFARQGNALFGLRCNSPGCGLVPAQRAAGETFEIAIYGTPLEAVRAYVHNLNTDDRYREFRRLRAELRRGGTTLSGDALVHGLEAYSELGAGYFGLLQAVIGDNDLARLDD